VNSTGPQPRVTRRTFLTHSVATTVALGMAAGRAADRPESSQPAGGTGSDPPGQTKVIDCHAHLNHRSRSTWEADDRKLIDAADKLGIDQLCCSILTPRRPTTAEGFQECNRWAADGMRRFPGRVRGYCYINPGYRQEALDEMRRCVEDQGFVGIKL
jgi:predicted TIM-barrel fold metal-dependent hydrolase